MNISKSFTQSLLLQLGVTTFGQIATAAKITYAKKHIFRHINKKKLKRFLIKSKN
jgi:hypothetical protein